MKRLISYLKHTTALIPVVFVLGTIAANIYARQSGAADFARENLGGPANIGLPTLANIATALEATFGTNDAAPQAEDVDSGAIIVEDSSLLNTANPQSSVLVNRDGLIIYKVQKGDTLSGIAANFGVSLNTVYWANKGVKSGSLRIGQEITILPVTGIIHQVQSGETLESIAGTYGASEARIAKYNRKALAQGLAVGINLIVPDAKPKDGNTATVGASTLPNLPNYFAIPTTGWNWGKLHNYNAVDIANACGTPIYAAAEGLVADAKEGGWNEGYGGYIIIEHPNGTKTRYSHNSKNVASVGNYVLQGDLIAHIGNTGNVHGPTGCHLHFEVMGARNPFAK